MSGATLLVTTHAVTAAVGLLLGGYQLVRRRKGDHTHRLLGWVWVLGMLFVASSSFAIRDLRDGQFSLLHLLALVTLTSLVVGVVGARRGNIRAHRASMRGSWFGLVGAFIPAIAIPGRDIPTFTVTNPVGALFVALAVVSLTGVLIGLAHAMDRRRTPGGTVPSRQSAERGTVLARSRR